MRDTFTALGCRDVARIDLRLTKDGTVFVIEVNPLPGLTPDFSDLCTIGKVAGMDYRTLIGEILAGSIKRFREKKQPIAALSVAPIAASVAPPKPPIAAPPTPSALHSAALAVAAAPPPSSANGG